MDNAQKFRSIVSAILRVPEDRVTDGLSAEDVDTWDSLNHISLVGALEQEFGVTLPAERLGDFMSVAQLKSLLAKQGVEI